MCRRIYPIKHDRAIEVRAERVTVHDRRGNSCSFEWHAVDRIQTYKLDLMFTDDVCLEFLAGGCSCVADEDATGWEELTNELAARLPISGSWFANVVQPPFATNRAVLWDRTVQEARARLSLSQINELWRLAGADFRGDGTLRDVYINNVTANDWNDVLAIARGMCGIVTITSRGEELKHDLSDKHFTGKNRASIEFRVGRIPVSAHCFRSSQIELSFKPEELQSSTDLTHLLDFLVAVAVFLRSPVILTRENAPQAPIFTIDANGEVQFHAPSAG